MVICTVLSFLSLFSKAMAATRERSFIMVKPDGVQRGLVGKIIKRFEEKGFKLVALKFSWVRKLCTRKKCICRFVVSRGTLILAGRIII
jgi:nucleoside-diphosphate kinase